MIARAALLIVFVAAFASVAAAQDGVPMPEISAGQGDACVRDIEVMRRDHWTLLLHQRDETVKRGSRSASEGLKQCISCHAVAGEHGQPVGYDDPKHFCRVCHDYAAVKIDCFECHASRPPEDTPESLAWMMFSPPGSPFFRCRG